MGRRSPVAGHVYSAALSDEIWIDGALVESRLSYGEARQNGTEIVASDRTPEGTLPSACQAEMARVREVVREIEGARIRVVVRATSDEPVETTIAITIAGLSIVTTPHHAIADAAMLRALLTRPPTPDPRPPDLPLVWRNGSAAVLLHEAAGHAAEHGHRPLSWPRWLRVRDVAVAPSVSEGSGGVGGAAAVPPGPSLTLGVTHREADLLAGEPPRALRRATFRDVPLPRMTNVVVVQHHAPFDLPSPRIDVHLIAAGSYEPLSETVTIEVAVAELDGVRLPPFDVRASRSAVAASLIGAQGEPIRYPGVICSREGQELFVGSSAPVVVTMGLP